VLGASWSPSNWIALAAVVSGAATAIAVPIFAGRRQERLSKEDRAHVERQAEQAREHDRTMAADARNQERRAKAYLEILQEVRRATLGVQRTRPIWVEGEGPPPPAPESLTDVDAIALEARIAAFGSDTVREWIAKWSQARREFDNAHWYLTQMERHPQQLPSETKADYGVALTEQQLILGARRQHVVAYEVAVQAQVRAELEGKESSGFVPVLAPIPGEPESQIVMTRSGDTEGEQPSDDAPVP